MADTKKIIILVGPPGSGKGTQAEMLAEKFGLVHLESSKVIEEKIKNADPIATSIMAIISVLNSCFVKYSLNTFGRNLVNKYANANINTYCKPPIAPTTVTVPVP